MGEEASVKETISLYSRLWRLPSYRGLALQMVAMVFIATLALSGFRVLLTPTFDLLTMTVHYLAVIAIPCFLGPPILYVIMRQEGSPLDARRTLGLVQFGFFFWIGFSIIGGLLGLLLGDPGLEIRLSMFGMAISYLITSFIVTGMSDHHPLRNFLSTLIPPILWYLSLLLLSFYSPYIPNLPIYWIIIITLSYLASAVAVHYIFRSVSKPFERDLGISGPDLFRAFGHDYLANNPEPFEHLMTQIATIQDVPMEVMVFKNDDVFVGVAVILYVHPGPFRDISGSNLPSQIIDHIRKTCGVPTIVMHGTCTHHQNLTTKDDIPLILAELDRLVAETKVNDLASGPHWTDDGRFKVWTFFSGNDVLTISTSAPLFTDDVALEVGRDAAETVRGRLNQVGGVAIVDAHNCIDDEAVSVMPSDPQAADYVGAISSAVYSTINESKGKISAGLYQYVPSDIESVDGLGPGGVSALIFKSKHNETAIASIDGNNMEPGFREEIRKLLKAQGFDQAEAITTDTHVVNAIALSSRGYPPVGRYKPQEILDAVVVAASKAREAIQPVSIGLGFGEVKGIRTFGEKGFDTLTRNIVEGAHIAKRVGVGASILTLLFSALLTFLL